jgi:hypothetical protein
MCRIQDRREDMKKYLIMPLSFFACFVTVCANAAVNTVPAVQEIGNLSRSSTKVAIHEKLRESTAPVDPTAIDSTRTDTDAKTTISDDVSTKTNETRPSTRDNSARISRDRATPAVIRDNLRINSNVRITPDKNATVK